MYNKYTRQPEKLRAWQCASYVERAPQREKKPAPPPPRRPSLKSAGKEQGSLEAASGNGGRFFASPRPPNC